MDFAQLIKVRQSVRNYRRQAVAADTLAQLVEAVRLAPSACNAQPWRLILVDEPQLKEQVARATFSRALSFNRFALQAPVIAVLVVEKPRWTVRLGAFIQRRAYPLIDIGIAAAHFCLQAADLGLGTCMLGWFDERAVKKLLHIPARKRIGLLIALGYPANDDPIRPKTRKNTDEMSRFNRYD